MKIGQIEEIAQSIVKNFSGKIKVFLFGSMARSFYKDVPDFIQPQDLDLFFEVELKIFEEYCRKCQSEEFNLFGQPYDPYSMYWSYHSSAMARWEIIQGIFQIDDSLSKEIVSGLGGRNVDIIILPFGWKKNEKVLTIMDFQDAEFSENIQGDKKLIFEK